MDEQWKPVVGFEGLYEVSDQGRVRSLDRKVGAGYGSTRMQRGAIKSLTRGKDGRYRVKLWRDGKEYTFTAYSLMMRAFVGLPKPGEVILHYDDDPSNNVLSNLRYGTESENMHDLVRNGKHSMANKTHCPQGHELTPDNLTPSSLKKGRRDCLTCSRDRSRRAYDKKRKVRDA